MTVSIWKPLLVDRISIKVVTKSKDLHAFVVGQLYGMVDIQKDLVPNGKIIVVPHKYRKRLEYYPEYKSKKQNRRIAEIDVGAFIPLNGQIQLDFRLTLYPSQFKTFEFSQFKATLATILPDYSYDKLFQSGRVNYLELACDSRTYPKNGFLPYRKYCTKSYVAIETNGHSGTTYVGSQRGELRFAIYDKYKQLKDKGKNPSDSVLPHTRIEARMRNLGIPASELGSLENPFHRLQIADLAKAQDLSANVDWQSFISDSLKYGVPDALVKRPKQRKQYRAALDMLQVPWWLPAERWATLPTALAAIAP